MDYVFLFSPGPTEIIVILVIVLLLFGGKKIPELMKGLVKGIREFNSAKTSIKDEIEEGMKPEQKEEVKKTTDEA